MALKQIEPALVIALKPGLTGLEQHLGLRGIHITTGRIRWSDRDHLCSQQASESKGGSGVTHGSNPVNPSNLAPSVDQDLNAFPQVMTRCDVSLGCAGLWALAKRRRLFTVGSKGTTTRESWYIPNAKAMRFWHRNGQRALTA